MEKVEVQETNSEPIKAASIKEILKEIFGKVDTISIDRNIPKESEQSEEIMNNEEEVPKEVKEELIESLKKADYIVKPTTPEKKKKRKKDNELKNENVDVKVRQINKEPLQKGSKKKEEQERC